VTTSSAAAARNGRGRRSRKLGRLCTAAVPERGFG
jgi:hypothetical protein